ncbi:MAG: cupin domain-containing protein [Gammaproteobacteria bacterium]
MAATAEQTAIVDSPTSRARFYDPENFFSFSLPPVPRRRFLDERDRALAESTPGGEIPLDASDVLGTPYSATTPLLLARYLRIRAGEQLNVARRASAEIFYVLHGTGRTTGYGEEIPWSTDDAFCFPGGDEVSHRAATGTVLFSVCNEPLLRFESLEPPRARHARVSPVLWSSDEMAGRLETLLARPASDQMSGRALQLASAQMEPARHPVPSINVAMNTLEPGGNQRPHRHNGVAITLAIQGEGVYSMIEDERVEWSTGAAMVTPGAELHSHHNRGAQRMKSIVFQDEGLHFYTRTPGFSWD